MKRLKFHFSFLSKYHYMLYGSWLYNWYILHVMVHCSLITHLGWCSRPSLAIVHYWSRPSPFHLHISVAYGYNDHGLNLHKLKFICLWFWHTCDRYLWLRCWWFKHIYSCLDLSFKLSHTHLHHPFTCLWFKHLSASSFYLSFHFQVSLHGSWLHG